MKSLFLAEKSLVDLENILTYISRDKPIAAAKFVDELR
jgi:plasmid stabilization system protein ParE